MLGRMFIGTLHYGSSDSAPILRGRCNKKVLARNIGLLEYYVFTILTPLQHRCLHPNSCTPNVHFCFSMLLSGRIVCSTCWTLSGGYRIQNGMIRGIWTGVSSSTGLWGRLDSLFATIHSQIVGNGKYWSDGWGETQRLAHLTAIHSRRFGPRRAGSLYCDGDEIPHIEWKSVPKITSGRTQIGIWEGEFASPVQVQHSRGRPSKSKILFQRTRRMEPFLKRV